MTVEIYKDIEDGVGRNIAGSLFQSGKSLDKKPPAFFRAANRAIKSQRLIIAEQFFLSFFSRCTSRDIYSSGKKLSAFSSAEDRAIYSGGKKLEKKPDV